MKLFSIWLVVAHATATDNQGPNQALQDVVPYLKALRERELNGEKPYTVEEVFDIFKTEVGIDLEELLAQNGKVITKSDIESQVDRDRQALNRPPVSSGFGGGSGLFEGLDDDGDVLPGDFSRGFGGSTSFSSLSSTTNSIMSAFWGINSAAFAMPTPPPAPQYSTKVRAAWANWQAWSACTHECGGGSRRRHRACKKSHAKADCPGSHRQIGFCNTQPCPRNTQWSAWAAWGSCTRTCGVGQQIRRRQCNGTSCVGESVNVQMCTNGSCSVQTGWNAWSSWSACSRTCGGGGQLRLRTCPAGKTCPGKSKEYRVCNKGVKCANDMNLVWSSWSDCSATCGDGTRTRSRICTSARSKCRRYKLNDSQSCKAAKPCGEWANWQAWATCTVSCGLGVKSRIRSCVDGTPGQGGCVGSYEDVSPCNSQTCPSWTAWQPWSACTETCGGGIQRRARYCMNGSFTDCPGNASEERQCQTDPCPRWSVWSEWSDCSAECGGGTTTVERHCIDGSPGQRGCFGQSSLSAECNTKACATWTDWGAFSPCTVSCGGGVAAQSRQCTGGLPGVECLGEHERTQPCNEHQCPVWSAWGDWSNCSVTCGKGVRSRNRSCPVEGACIGPGPGADDVQFCGSTECPSWTEWGDYSSCSKSCGGGLKQRSRACNAGFGRCGSESPYERVACNTEACPAPEWSEWSECTKKCGGGNQSRSRQCDRNECPAGGNFQTMQCNQQACEWLNWSEWSLCDAEACGSTGNQSRSRQCDGENCIGEGTENQTCSVECQKIEFSPDLGSIEDFVEEINAAKATAEPDIKEKCFTLNVNGDCLDHLDYSKDDTIVELGGCSLPAFIIQNGKVMAQAEFVTDTKVRYRCMESYKLRGPKNLECKCRGKNCRQQPKKTPKCIKDNDKRGRKRDAEHNYDEDLYFFV